MTNLRSRYSMVCLLSDREQSSRHSLQTFRHSQGIISTPYGLFLSAIVLHFVHRSSGHLAPSACMAYCGLLSVLPF